MKWETGEEVGERRTGQRIITRLLRDMALKARRVDSDVPVKPFMSGQNEHDTVKAFVNILASQPVTFHDDFQELPEKTLKKVPVLQVSARIDHLHSPKRTPSL